MVPGVAVAVPGVGRIAAMDGVAGMGGGDEGGRTGKPEEETADLLVLLGALCVVDRLDLESTAGAESVMAEEVGLF